MMAKPLAMDLRERVIKDVEAGLSAAAAALTRVVRNLVVMATASIGTRTRRSRSPEDVGGNPAPARPG